MSALSLGLRRIGLQKRRRVAEPDVVPSSENVVNGSDNVINDSDNVVTSNG